MTLTSFRSRLTLRWASAFAAILVVCCTATWLGFRSFAESELNAELRTLAGTELASAIDDPRGIHLHELPTDAMGIHPFADKLVQILDSSGRLLMASALAPRDRSLLPEPLIGAALAGEAPGFDTQVDDMPLHFVALRAEYGKEVYLLLVGLSTESLERSLRRLAILLIAAGTLALASTSVVGYLLASQALAPVQRITERAAAISRGAFSARLDPPARDDELGRMTRLLNEMLASLERAIEANRRFAADASHELRNPLTALRGEAEVALKRERPAADYREALDSIRDQAEQMSGLLDGLMLLVRAQEGRSGIVLEELDLAPVFREAIDRAAPAAAERGVRITAEPLAGLVVYGERRLLARVLDNLLVNAIQYNRAGGEVAVGAAWLPTDGLHGGEAVRFTVRDTGPGIPDEALPRIFERFFRADPSRSQRTGGFGLGLSICREVVGLFGGEIAVAENSESGTTFAVTLPGRRREGRTGEINLATLAPPGDDLRTA